MTDHPRNIPSTNQYYGKFLAGDYSPELKNRVSECIAAFEALDVAAYARDHQYAVVVSERSGETEDDILSDITVALNTGVIKTGGVRGSDRGSNYNRFMEIEEELGKTSVYAGKNYRRLP